MKETIKYTSLATDVLPTSRIKAPQPFRHINPDVPEQSRGL